MLVWIVVQSAAITVILTRATLFAWARTRGPKLWREFASCPLCVGFWVGYGLFWLRAAEAVKVRDIILRPYGLVSLNLTALGLGAAAGCLALLFVLIWSKLDE